MNFAWVLVAVVLVTFMHAGFALMETGLCRGKNAAHIMSMNFLVYPLAIIAFFVCGFALMCGGANAHPLPIADCRLPIENQILDHMVTIGGRDGWGLLGGRGFFLSSLVEHPAVLMWFLLMMVMVSIATTIPTGALLGRWRFKSFCFLTLLLGGIIVPVYGCWVWGGGWLAQLGIKAGLGHGMVDFAGSSVIHMQGGVIALVCSILLGPRLGKFDESGNPRPILGHHMPMVFLGTFILAFGWFGLNVGPLLGGNDSRVATIAVNTVLSSAAGTLAAALYMWGRFGKPDPSMMCNGLLAGLVAISAGCAFVSPGAALFIGAAGGVISASSVFFWDRMGIDDPVGAISVHGVNGLWGTLAVGLFANGTYGEGYHGVAGAVTGLFYGGGFSQLLAQVIGIATCLAWDALAAGIAFWAIGKLLGSNRVPPEVEIAGLDIPEMGAPGYPEFITAIAPEQVTNSEIAAARTVAKAGLFQWAQS